MKLIITTGTQSDESFTESHRWTIEVAEDATIAEVLEQVKIECVSSIPVLDRPAIKRHLYLMHPGTRVRFDEGKSISDSGLSDDSILCLMSAVR